MFLYNNKVVTSNSITRAGVIPYTIENNRLYFLMGIDRKTRELTDFGGGAKSNESMVQAGFRELAEESCEIFTGHITMKNLLSSPAIINDTKSAIIFFCKVEPFWLNCAEENFIQNQRLLCNASKHNELIGIKWIEQHYFKTIAFNRKNQCMWKRVQNIIRSSTNWNELRMALLIGAEIKSVMSNPLFANNINIYPNNIIVQ